MVLSGISETVFWKRMWAPFHLYTGPTFIKSLSRNRQCFRHWDTKSRQCPGCPGTQCGCGSWCVNSTRRDGCSTDSPAECWARKEAWYLPGTSGRASQRRQCPPGRQTAPLVLQVFCCLLCSFSRLICEKSESAST